MKKILVPTDFSSCAEYATKTAISLAKKMDAHIHLLHFTSIPMDWVNLSDQSKMYPDVTERIKEKQEQLDQIIKDCEKEGVQASSYIGYNESYQNIIDHVDLHHIDLIVMGSHGTAGVKRMLMGSNAQQVVRLSQTPLLVVKPNIVPVELDSLVIV